MNPAFRVLIASAILLHSIFGCSRDHCCAAAEHCFAAAAHCCASAARCEAVGVCVGGGTGHVLLSTIEFTKGDRFAKREREFGRRSSSCCSGGNDHLSRVQVSCPPVCVGLQSHEISFHPHVGSAMAAGIRGGDVLGEKPSQTSVGTVTHLQGENPWGRIIQQRPCSERHDGMLCCPAPFAGGLPRGNPVPFSVPAVVTFESHLVHWGTGVRLPLQVALADGGSRGRLMAALGVWLL